MLRMVLKHLVFGIVSAYVGYVLYDAYFDRLDTGSLRGKNVLVTGASSGIGEETAYAYARLGANVFITARREQLLQQVVNKCKIFGNEGAKFGYITADMSRERDTERVIQEGVRLLGGIDHLVLNHAAINMRTDEWNGTAAQVAKLSTMLEVNVVSFVRLTAHALPHLRQSAGAITVVSSFVGRFPVTHFREYVTTKFALDGFFSSLRSEFVKRHENVSITVCFLGLIDTDAALTVIDSMQDIAVTKSPTFRRIYRLFSPSPSDTAIATISATTRRHPELWYPWYQGLTPMVVLRQFFPTMTDYM